MEITTTARHPFEKCALDIVCPMMETMAGSKYILTCQNDLSKFLAAAIYDNDCIIKVHYKLEFRCIQNILFRLQYQVVHHTWSWRRLVWRPLDLLRDELLDSESASKGLCSFQRAEQHV